MASGAILDQSLDAILAAKPRQARKSRPSKSSTNGVKKTTTKPVKTATTATKKNLKVPESNKIIIHGLPQDVTERQIKEYITDRIGPVARCELAYNAQGQSKGTATIVFRKDAGTNLAAKAVSHLNGRSIDSSGARPLKLRVEIITEIPQPGLAERLGGLPKEVQQGVARNAKKGSKGSSGATAVKSDNKSKKTKKTAAPGRVQKVAKTSDELDADMADYFAAAAQ